MVFVHAGPETRRVLGVASGGSRVAYTWVRSLHTHDDVSRPRGAERMALTAIDRDAPHRAGAQHFQEEQ